MVEIPGLTDLFISLIKLKNIDENYQIKELCLLTFNFFN